MFTLPNLFHCKCLRKFGLASAVLVSAYLIPAAKAESLLDVSVSPVPPADEAEDPGFPAGSPTGPNPINFFDAYSWKTFIALNWPAKAGERGVPDTAKDISDTTAPRVWETWKSVSDIYQPGGVEPSEWTSFDAASVCQDANGTPGAPVKVLPFAMAGPVLEDFNQVNSAGQFVGSLVARNHTYVRYEITVNQLMFDTIRGEKLYRRKTLEEMQQQNMPIIFKDQSIEIKAAWRELKSPADDAQRDRFYHVKAMAFDPETKHCETKEFALIGFHIGQKTTLRRQWIWSTFEHADTLHVDSNSPAGTESSLVESSDLAHATPSDGGINEHNPPKPNPDPTQVFRLITNSSVMNVSRPNTDATNKKWQQHEKIRNTVWRNYRLVLTQWPTVKNLETGLGSPFPSSNVANVTMETYPEELQKSSCIQCHLQTPFKTDFAWFLSLRAFPVPPSGGILGGNVPDAARAKVLNAHMNKARERAFQTDPEPTFK